MQSEEFEDLYELRDTLTIALFDVIGHTSLSSEYGDKYKEIDRLCSQILYLSDEFDELLSEAISLVNEEDNVD